MDKGCTCERDKQGNLLYFIAIVTQDDGRTIREKHECYSMDCPVHGLEALFPQEKQHE